MSVRVTAAMICSDQGWGNTGDSKLFLEVFDPISGEKVHRSSFVLTHNLREIRRVFDEEDDLVKHSGLGLALRLVMVSAPWPGWLCVMDWDLGCLIVSIQVGPVAWRSAHLRTNATGTRIT